MFVSDTGEGLGSARIDLLGRQRRACSPARPSRPAEWVASFQTTEEFMSDAYALRETLEDLKRIGTDRCLGT